MSKQYKVPSLMALMLTVSSTAAFAGQKESTITTHDFKPNIISTAIFELPKSSAGNVKAGITKGMEAHRRARPYNMGSLFWQLNDCWPAVSWSSIDFFGNWKALHYSAKKAFKNVLISSEIDKDTLKVFIVNKIYEVLRCKLQRLW